MNVLVDSVELFASVRTRNSYGVTCRGGVLRDIMAWALTCAVAMI